MSLTYEGLPESDVVVNYVNARFSKGLNTNICVIGLSGTGKSSVTHRIGELIIASRPKENLKFHFCDSLLGLLKAIRSSKPGDIIGVDEVSVLFPSRRAMSKENVAVNSIFDTVRKRRLCIISNAPIWGSIESHLRAMFHIRITTLKIVRKEQVVVSGLHRLQTNPASGKTYTHTFTRKGRDVHRIITRMPNLSKWEEYERQKDKFMDDLYTRLEEEQRKKLGKDLPRPKVTTLSKRELEIHDLVHRQGLSQKETAAILKVDPSFISRVIKNIKKKAALHKEMAQMTSKSLTAGPRNIILQGDGEDEENLLDGGV